MKKPYLLLAGMLLCTLTVFCAPEPTKTLSPTGLEEIRSNLYLKPATGAPVLLDGNLTQYNTTYNNNLDGMDARKMSNFSENLGLLRDGYVLVIERRQTIIDADTIFYKMWLMQQKAYQLEFVTSNLNHPGMEGFLEDSYLHTSTPVDLNGNTTVDFTISTDPASALATRFRIIFKNIASGPLAVNFTTVRASLENQHIKIDWKTENEFNMKEYVVEKSADGTHFQSAGNVRANNYATNSYSWTDVHTFKGNTYYRILSSETDGTTRYSKIVSAFTGTSNSQLHVFPNPVEGTIIHFQLQDQPAGQYKITLFNAFGLLVCSKDIQHPGGNINENLQPNQNLTKGVYHLEISGPATVKKSAEIIY